MLDSERKGLFDVDKQEHCEKDERERGEERDNGEGNGESTRCGLVHAGLSKLDREGGRSE